METQTSTRTVHPAVRQLATLKVLSRLIGHELHAQASTKAIALSRDEVIEIQTTIDLFIEELTRRMAGAAVAPTAVSAVDMTPVGVRN